ncbi:MAG: hypothetical protein EB133_13280, partial [Betaproteobacteria bacterium]|nr:hypothetical protein [Betaproteobacteria bacterium]
ACTTQCVCRAQSDHYGWVSRQRTDETPDAGKALTKQLTQTSGLVGLAKSRGRSLMIGHDGSSENIGERTITV